MCIRPAGSARTKHSVQQPHTGPVALCASPWDKTNTATQPPKGPAPKNRYLCARYAGAKITARQGLDS